MISDQKLQYYKEEYSGHKLIYVRFSNQDFVFRTLTVKEYEMILKMYSDQFKQETAICNIACIHPDAYEFSECEFGVLPSVIAGYLKKLSAFDNPQDIFDEYDAAKASSNLYQQCMDLIKAFIKDYTYEEMEDWTWQKLIEMTVRAENIAKLQGYDYHIEKSEDIDNINKLSIHNQESIDNLIKQKINPLIFFKDEIQKEININNNIVNNPFIIGKLWNNKELLDGFKKQKAESRI
jgi:hypothetical protein